MRHGERARARAGSAERALVESLEPRTLLSTAVAVDFIHLFYGNSVFDHGGPRDSAIATDKFAMLPGQRALFGNITSYVKGINGLILDIANWNGDPIPITFRVGRSTDTSTWTTAPAPSAMSQYPGAGGWGERRLVIVWTDGSIRDEWLQITVGGPGSIMPTPEVFYFGNQVGFSGNDYSDAAVNVADEYGAREDPHSFSNAAPITNVHDYNRDGRVDAADQLIARNNFASAANAIQFFGVTPPSATALDFDAFLRDVQPLQNSLNGQQPITYWGLPWPTGYLPDMLADHSLKGVLDAYVERGFVPVFYAKSDTYWPNTIAMAQGLEQDGLPVTVIVPQNDLLQSTAYQNASVWATGTNAALGGATVQYPCLPQANSAPGAAQVTALLQPFKNAGITVNRVIFDDESLPAPWNGIWEAERDSAACQPFYPAGVLGNYDNFVAYVLNLRTQLEQQIMLNPVHALWPNAYVGNFNESDSSAKSPYYLSSGTTIPPRSLGLNSLSLPGAYAAPYELGRYTQNFTQADADNYYLRYLLRTITSSLQNKTSTTEDIPFLCQSDGDLVSNPTLANLGMSTARYEELLRQVWLRGADSQMLFAYSTVPDQIGAQLDAARSVLGEMLGYGAFITKGQPMNLTNPAIGAAGPIWSGMKLGSQCLIRTFTDAATDGTVAITAFAGVTVTLPAPTTGATFIVNSDGTFTRVDSGTAAAAAPTMTAITRTAAAAASPITSTTSPTSSTVTSSSLFWQDWEKRRGQAPGGGARRRSGATFSSTPIRA